TRILFQYVLPILLPSLVYLGWLTYERRRIARGGAGKPTGWRDGPWPLLVGSGIVLAALITLAATLLDGAGIEGTYVPPRVEDGRIVPGHMEPPAPQK